MKEKIRIITDDSHIKNRGTFLDNLDSHSFQNTNKQLDKTHSDNASDKISKDYNKKRKNVLHENDVN